MQINVGYARRGLGFLLSSLTIYDLRVVVDGLAKFFLDFFVVHTIRIGVFLVALFPCVRAYGTVRNVTNYKYTRAALSKKKKNQSSDMCMELHNWSRELKLRISTVDKKMKKTINPNF